MGARVVEHLKLDGQKWAGTIPAGPGLWKGTNPGGIDEVRWKPLMLASASQFRPAAPPAPDSAERAAEIAALLVLSRWTKVPSQRTRSAPRRTSVSWRAQFRRAACSPLGSASSGAA